VHIESEPGVNLIKRLRLIAPLIGIVLVGCGQIWNAGDLVDWVEQQAVDAGCAADTIELDDWYTTTPDGNVWMGTCVDAQSGDTVELAINVDNVWTPSQTVSSETTGSDNVEAAATQEAIEEPTPEPVEETPAADLALTSEQLKNTSYSGIYEEPITLTDGSWEGEPVGEGDASRPTVDYIDGQTLFGDLDDDGVGDAAVFLLDRGGGSGAFTWVSAQLNQDGQPVDAGAVMVGDRIMVRSTAIEDGQIVLGVVVAGPGGAACCPTHKASVAYAVQDSRLIELPRDDAELVRISLDDLDGTQWTLAEINYDEPALDEPAVTIRFEGDTLSGSGGCNSYNGTFTLGEDNPFVMTVGPVATTLMACPDPVGSQEAAYHEALNNATSWGYDFGNLVISYPTEGDGYGRLLFVPAGAAE
jgi:heat shock protein HslJ